MTTDLPAREQVRRSMAALELASIRHRSEVRRRLRVGEEELSALLYLAHHGGVMQHELTRVTSLSRSGTGAMLQRLEERGYLTRRTDPADRRLRFVELSASGREQVDQAYREFTGALDRVLAEDDPAGIAAVARVLEELADAVAPADRRPAEPAEGAGEVETEPIWRHWA
jgi:MarR family transcriptional regulator, lower aerobic nicotinate degradation pathway regulator